MKLVKQAWVVIALLGLIPLACTSEKADAEVPAMLRHQFQTQMKTILHDVKVAEEQASALEGKYLELDELRGKYFNRVVSDKYSLTMRDVSTTTFTAEVVHKASGLNCRLAVGASGAGIPKCD